MHLRSSSTWRISNFDHIIFDGENGFRVENYESKKGIHFLLVGMNIPLFEISLTQPSSISHGGRYIL